jgi:BirA family biotin operon repressor/biotin-[acetyl-CoA-carboxylase] ligase
MQEAAALASSGCLHGTAVVAESQSAGVGRHGHVWHSEPGTGLYVSIVLRLPLTPAELPILTLALGLAASEAIALTTGLVCDLRWPNDILTGGKKVSGILVQIVDGAAIAGIGVNVNQSSFPEWIAQEATSLQLATGRQIDREAVLAQLLKSVADLCDVLVSGGNAAVLELFSAASTYAHGKRVRVDLGSRVLEGVTAGLTEQGFLRVRKADGTMETVVAGGVRPA